MAEQPGELYAEGVHVVIDDSVVRLHFIIAHPTDLERGFYAEDGEQRFVVARIALAKAGAKELRRELAELKKKRPARQRDAKKANAIR